LIEKNLKLAYILWEKKKTNSEVDAILKKYGDGKGIKYEGFKEFMVSILGVTDNKEDILRAFKTINRGDEFGNIKKMEIVMEEGDVGYFNQTAKKEDKGHNYVKWTEEIFAR